MISASHLPLLEISADDDDGLNRSEILCGNRLINRANEALKKCLQSPGQYETPLDSLKKVDVVLVSDETISKIHADFLNDPSPTDVITFHHGEILISTETATRVAAEHQHSAGRETLLYIIHGLLHLNGHHDSDPDEQQKMHRIQQEILNEIWPLGGDSDAGK